mmetsp:Transcript_25574/g.70369  ORF Transcript_25574/g.70369 Transcript_25574/m.70369 type:complete len:180 (-) Transcript_25574:1745-2284(-)
MKDRKYRTMSWDQGVYLHCIVHHYLFKTWIATARVEYVVSIVSREGWSCTLTKQNIQGYMVLGFVEQRWMDGCMAGCIRVVSVRFILSPVRFWLSGCLFACLWIGLIHFPSAALRRYLQMSSRPSLVSAELSRTGAFPTLFSRMTSRSLFMTSIETFPAFRFLEELPLTFLSALVRTTT